MKIYPRSITLAAIVIVFFNTQISDAQGTSAQSELQTTIRVVPNGKSTPGFEVELSNTGERDLVLNLGLIMADGPHAYAIHLALRDGQNNLQILDLAGPSIINGRIDPFIVPLPKRARIILQSTSENIGLKSNIFLRSSSNLANTSSVPSTEVRR